MAVIEWAQQQARERRRKSREIRVVGSRCGPFGLAIELLQAGRIDLSGLVTHRFGLEEAEQAFQMAVDPSAFKVVFDVLSTNKN